MTDRKYKALSLITIILGFFMALLDTTIVNITLPKMTAYYHTDVQTISWVVNGYNLAFAVLLITASRLADQFGRKKIFLLGVLSFTLTSFLSGISTSVNMLIVFRALQGLAAAMVVPVTMPLAIELFPPQRRGAVVGIWGAFAGLAAASGPALGGILTDKFQWQSIFFINIPLGVICLILTALLIKESYDPTASRRIDWPGMLSLSVAMFSLVLGLIQATDKGWTSTYILTLFGVFAVSFVAFILIEMKTAEPMIPLSMMRGPFAAANVTLFMLGVGMISGVFLLAFFLTETMGLNELKAGLLISAMPLTSMVCSTISGPLSDKLGSRWFGTLGLTLLALSVYLFSGLTADSSRLDVIWRLIIAGAGMGLTMSPMMGATIRNVPRDKIGVASGITNMTRTLGTVLGVALLVTIFNGNINTEMVNAKNKAVTIINASTVFDQKTKIAMTGEIRKAKISRESKPPQINQIIDQIDNKEKEVLVTVPPMAQSKIKASFASQKEEVRRVWPKISKTFTDSVALGFSSTFKIGSFMLVIGIIFAVFSDVPVSKRKKVLNNGLDMEFEGA